MRVRVVLWENVVARRKKRERKLSGLCSGSCCGPIVEDDKWGSISALWTLSTGFVFAGPLLTGLTIFYTLRPNDVLEFKIYLKKNGVLLNFTCVHVVMQQLIST